MPRKATGSVYQDRHGNRLARIRLSGDVRESFPLPTCTNDADAQARAGVLAEVATRLRQAMVSTDTARKVIAGLGACPARELRAKLRVVEELVGGELAPKGAPQVPTFRQIGDDWTSGRLHKRYPDHVKLKRSADDDASRLRLYVYDVLGPVPIDRVTLDQCEEVMRRLPPKMAVATRRNVGQLVTRIMAMAVYPLRLIPASPLPRGFLPKAGQRKALGCLYPDEDRALLACREVPLASRLLWGFLTREGMRLGEALALTWQDLDLERGAVRLDKNKTDSPRAWALSPGVAPALARFRAEHRPEAQKGDRVFLDAEGEPFSETGATGLPVALRAHLKLAGVDRAELYTTTKERQRLRVHDLRGTFVTVALANDRSEAWIADRTGHESSTMINRYKRTARTFGELGLGEMLPLDAAIPELASGPNGQGMGREQDGIADSETDSGSYVASPAGFERAREQAQVCGI